MPEHVVRTRLSREESQAQTRERLIEAARREVVRQGFGAASVRDIAEAAGYSQGAFYSNFQSKEDLLLELMRRHMRQEAQQLGAVLDSAGPSPDAAMSGLEAWASALNTDADWSMLAIELQLHANRSPGFAAAYDDVIKQHRADLGRIVARFFAMMALEPPAEASHLAMAFMALAHGLAVQRTRDEADLSGELILVFLKGLIASAQAARARP